MEASRQCQAGSLTGAVTSQSVTEVYEGSLELYRNQLKERKGIRELDCERDISSRDESRS